MCPTCQAERESAAESPPEPAAFDQLVAVVQEDETEPRLTEAAPPPDDEDVDETDPALLRNRQKSNHLWRIVAVMGSAIVLLGGWGLYGVVKQFGRSTPGDAAVWAQAKIEVADHVRAPKTAEFPKPGEIKRIRGAVPPRWSVKSVVDAKNEYGVPLRHHWFMEISFDTRSRKWEAEYIEIDDKRVYASEATQREDREYAEKRDARNKAAKKDRDKARPRPRADQVSKENVADGRGADSRAGTPVKTDSDPPVSFEVRRETGIWNQIVQFEGQTSHETARFKVKYPGWRFRWVCDGEATIRLLNAAHKPLEDEIDIGGGGEKGTRYVPKGTGEFTLKITTKSHWTLVVEE